MTADGTLGGYQRVHQRAPAFGGKDGHAYSVSTFVDERPDEGGRYGAALLFILWSEDGERAVGHLETDYLAFGRSSNEALAPVLALTLHQVKGHLDACIDRMGEGRGERGER
ncbi:MAG: hypothetical protein HYS40_07960 [Gemmatimonadetes bacterium]|nr:hypothetical protein [Gemmatimonadota bacterium]